MNPNNSSPNDFNNTFYDNMPVTNNHQQYQQSNEASPIQQQYDDSSDISHYNYQQYIQQSGISNNDVHNYHLNDQQPISNVVSNNSVSFSSGNNNHALNNIDIPHYNNQQSTFNTVSYPQFYHDQYQHNSPQSNILPLLNSFGININSPQATIIIMPTNPDIQNKLQQVLNYLNNKNLIDS
ncbi:hypothetical protein RclHR1_00850019 [Rhizophagus clarus]|uniref:Uncharacterized protein n=1 Tax=Rhizophagus clarus TaxID=94130 RepID=A0A2Z6S0N9_9GLOM|nr:hypothetical protein RclHR1_00850019 [Rhizophagus clarus]GES98095.1 hypothetical protein GLOIN_2v1880782 [Rhizophagus clarus]